MCTRTSAFCFLPSSSSFLNKARFGYVQALAEVQAHDIAFFGRRHLIGAAQKVTRLKSNLSLSRLLLICMHLLGLLVGTILLAELPALLRPWEVENWDDEEAIGTWLSAPVLYTYFMHGSGTHEPLMQEAGCREIASSMELETTYLFEVSAIPAKALYQAKKAAARANEPPAMISFGSGTPVGRCR